ncbi:hypothetical protein L873DRAFT_1826171 [Choiromyces venosus 120613-1]|uniref:HNH nuclease domain-containing protein n=1 Tax=Choiromyces venosus 120613-1 TaxID=1336337 RepID=A0A3N4K2S5_9PEZI|nr:hypothetical protein L873DRAFT_1826171 [Choiromyces venosus 120613-1]
MMFIATIGPIAVNDATWVHRLIAHNASEREDAFRDGVRARDGKCVILGVVNRGVYRGAWIGWEAAHIFLLEKESLWINSCQNGFILQATIHHQLFDQYLISVNPGGSYEIVVFDDDSLGLDGRILDPVCRDPANPHRVSDQLLRWHFRQSVLGNMRGSGEPIFEHDFPSGTDMMTEIREGPYTQERLEMEFALRWRGVG